MATPRPGSRGNVQFAELPSRAGGAAREQASGFTAYGAKGQMKLPWSTKHEQTVPVSAPPAWETRCSTRLAMGVQERAVACFI